MAQRVLVYSNTDPIEPRMILELLSTNGIEARLVGPDAALFGAGQVIVEQQVTVPHEQVDAARELIDAFYSDDVEFVEQGHDGEEHGNGAGEEPAPHPPLAADDTPPVWPPFIALTSVHAVLFWSTRGDQQRAMEIGALDGWPPAGELYRLVTSGFLHADLGHLLVNSAGLLVVIWIALQFLNLGRVTFVYAMSNLTAGVAAALVDSSIGSSGGFSPWFLQRSPCESVTLERAPHGVPAVACSTLGSPS